MGGIPDFCYPLLVEFWCCHLWTRPLPLAFDLLICGSVLKKWPLETQVAQIMNLLSLHFAGLAAGLRMSQGGATVQKRRDRSDELGDCRGTKETGMLRRGVCDFWICDLSFRISRRYCGRNRALEATGQIRQAFSLWADERRLR